MEEKMIGGCIQCSDFFMAKGEDCIKNYVLSIMILPDYLNSVWFSSPSR